MRQYLTWIIEFKSIPGKIYGNSGMVHFAEINQAPSPYPMLQHIGRVSTPKIVPRHCLRYLQTTLIMGGRGLVSEFMWGIVELKLMSICMLTKYVDEKTIFSICSIKAKGSDTP